MPHTVRTRTKYRISGEVQLKSVRKKSRKSTKITTSVKNVTMRRKPKSVTSPIIIAAPPGTPKKIAPIVLSSPVKTPPRTPVKKRITPILVSPVKTPPKTPAKKRITPTLVTSPVKTGTPFKKAILKNKYGVPLPKKSRLQLLLDSKHPKSNPPDIPLGEYNALKKKLFPGKLGRSKFLNGVMIRKSINLAKLKKQ